MPYLCHNYKLSSNSRPYINVKKVRGFLTISIILLCIGGTSPYVMSAQSAQAQDPIFEILPPTPANTTTQGGAGGNITSTTTPLGGDINATITTNETTVPPPISINDTLPTDNFTAPIGLNDTLPTDNFTAPIGLNDTLPTDNFTAPGAGGGQPGAEVGAAGDFGGGGAGQPGAEAGVPSDVAGGGQPTQLNETVPELAPTVQPPPLPPPPIYQILSNNTGDSTNPNVAVSGSNLYVVWEDTSSGNREILLMRSHDGSNFTSAQTLSNTTGESFDPRIAVSGSNVYVVWEDTATDGSSEVKFVRSADNGDTFGSVQTLSNQSRDSTNPTVAVSGGNVYVVWSGLSTNATAEASPEVMLTRSADNGAIFGSVQTLSNNTGDSTNPNVAVSGRNLYVLWEDDSSGNSEIVMLRSTNNGAKFVTPRNLSNSPGESFDPRIAVSGSNVYVVWEDYGLGNSTSSEIMLIRSVNRGLNYASAQSLSNSPGESVDPRIAVSGGNVYVVWEDTATDGSSEVKFARSTDNGATFTNARNLSNNTGISFDPRIDVSGGNVYVVWEDTTATESSDILLARSTNNGATFGLVQNLSNSPVESFDPSVIASRSKLFVTWSDDKEGDAEIIFTDKTRNIASANVSAATTTTEAGADLGLGAGGGDLGFGGAGGAGFGITPGNETGAGAGFGITPTPDASGGAGFGITPTPDASGGAGFGITPGTGGTAGGFQPIPPS
jgi:hypothetical protein